MGAGKCEKTQQMQQGKNCWQYKGRRRTERKMPNYGGLKRKRCRCKSHCKLKCSSSADYDSNNSIWYTQRVQCDDSEEYKTRTHESHNMEWSSMWTVLHAVRIRSRNSQKYYFTYICGYGRKAADVLRTVIHKRWWLCQTSAKMGNETNTLQASWYPSPNASNVYDYTDPTRCARLRLLNLWRWR